MKDKWLLDHFYVPQTEPAKPRSVQRIVRRQKPMTMPHLMNCEHSESGWCLACVRKLHDELEETRAILNDKCGNEECFDAMNKARIQQSLPKEYLEAITKAAKSSNDKAETSATQERGGDSVQRFVGRILCGDNCELLGQMPRESIDLVVTSPPYDNLRTYGGHTWDFERVARELTRVLKPGGVIVWVVADATVNGSETLTSMRQAIHFKDVCGLRVHDTMIWNKGKFSAVGALRTRYAPVFEFMFAFSKGTPAVFNPIKDRINKTAGQIVSGRIRKADGSFVPKSTVGKVTAGLGQRFNIWDICPQQGNNLHPAPFPEALARDHIISWSNEGDVVLDPFCGSGTTCLAAKELNRQWIGLEINPEYVRMAEARLVQEVPPLETRDIAPNT